MALHVRPETTSSFYLNVPATFIVCGPSGSGKTTTVAEMCAQWSKLTNNRQRLQDIYVFYSTYQVDAYAPFENCCSGCKLFQRGFPDEEFLDQLEQNREDFSDPKIGRVLVIDDATHELAKHPSQLQRLFQVVSHHDNISIFLIIHDLFANKVLKTLVKNAKYLMLTKSHFDFTTIQRLLLTGSGGILKSASDQCFHKLKRKYLIIDNTADCKPEHRLKNFDDPPVIFEPLP
jgi:energy-coupling factor transporter ATP-binding protein EcfA2